MHALDRHRTLGHAQLCRPWTAPKLNLESQLVTRLAFLNASPSSGMFWLAAMGMGDLSNVSITVHKMEGDGLRLIAQKQVEFLANGAGTSVPDGQFRSKTTVDCLRFV
jgi:hypothetical protein